MKNVLPLATQVLGIFVVGAVLLGLSGFCAKSQAADQAKPAATPALIFYPLDKEAQAERDAHVASLTTLKNLLASRKDKDKQLKTAKKARKLAADEVDKKQLTKQAESLQTQINEINRQISGLATGTSDEAFKEQHKEKIDLNTELRQLVEPFVIMLKSATREAREIENMRHRLQVTRQQRDAAANALKNLEPLMAANTDKQLKIPLKTVQQKWLNRQNAADDLVATLDRQLKGKMEARASPADTADAFFTDFVKNRGRSLVLGLAAFIGVLAVMRLLQRAVIAVFGKRIKQRSFFTRLLTLVFAILTMFFAILALLAVFNLMKDWLLLGVSSLFILALTWLGVKMLPNMIEQITLLLNLGAVQEKERVLLNGVPWRVERLDFYTDLINPELDGGSFTLPVRELIGLHSRPAANDEAWFPTRKGDWVQLQNGTIGKVVIQTPELVQLVELGGARHTYGTHAYLDSAPKNLSAGFRVRVKIGLDYKHQSIATTTLPETLKAFVQEGLSLTLKKEDLLNVDVDLVAAAASSLDFEVEADIAGRAAAHYENIERDINRLIIDACNEHGWSIPFAQLVVHRSPTGGASEKFGELRNL